MALLTYGGSKNAKRMIYTDVRQGVGTTASGRTKFHMLLASKTNFHRLAGGVHTRKKIILGNDINR
jgi:hypothetical protein